MNLMLRRTLLLLTITSFVLVSPVPIRVWQLEDVTLKRIPVPPALHLIQAETAADLDSDGAPDALTLAGGRATIRSGDQTRWQSPPAWEVTQAHIADLNRDGLPEVALLAWRPFKPWPVDAWLPNGGRIESFQDSHGKSCHIILIGWMQGAFRELWAGSALADPVNRFAAVDLAGNGQQYLVALEGGYDDPPAVPSRRLKVWEWNGFGFTVVHVLEDSFSLMVPAQLEDRQVLILAY
jgi:hypothetical protein